MGELKQFNKFIAEDVIGGCCLDGSCEHKSLNIKDKQDKE